MSSLSGLSGSASGLGQVALPEFPKLPPKIRQIDPQGAAKYEAELTEFFKKFTKAVKR